MLENRSFDNLLGQLYPGRPDFEGLTGNEINPDGFGGRPSDDWLQSNNEECCDDASGSLPLIVFRERLPVGKDFACE